MNTSRGATPLVSVIMPAYNEERYLGEAMASILAQTHANLELIVVDDGSTDRTPDIVREYAAKDSRVRYARQANGGQSVGRNTGIGMARGPFIAYHDADDMSCPTRIATELDLLLNRPGVEAVHCGMEVIAADGRILRRVPARPLDGDRLLLGNFVCCGSVLHARGLLDRTGPWSDELDWGMWLRMSEHTSFGCVPDPLYRYRVHGRNLSAARGWIGNRRIDIRVFEDRYRRRHEPFVRWKVRSLKWQVAIGSRLPKGRPNRFLLFGMAKVFGIAERALFRLAHKPRR